MSDRFALIAQKPETIVASGRDRGLENWKSEPGMLTLGINYSQMHDSSACIVRDGELLFAVAEERLSRQKHDARFPYLAIEACLKFAEARADELDEVCFGWQTAGPVYRHDLKLYATGGWP